MGYQNQTKTMSTFVLKLHSKSNDELRRVSVTTDISLDALLTRLRELFALSGKSRIALKYVDEDGDTITIGSTAELHECMALAQSLGKVSTKISVETDEKPAVETNARRDERTSSNAAPSAPDLGALFASLFGGQQSANNAAPQAPPSPLPLLFSMLGGVPNFAASDSNNAPFAPFLAQLTALMPNFEQVLAEFKAEPEVRALAEKFGINLEQPLPELLQSIFANEALRTAFMSGKFADFCPNRSADSQAAAAAASSSAGENASTDEKKDNEPVVHRAICDACEQTIVGIRFKCAACPDYDLCEKCHPNAPSLHAPNHPFLVITESEPAPQRFGRCGGGAWRQEMCRRRCARMQAMRRAAEREAEEQARVSAKLLAHESVPHGTAFISGSPFVKLWRVRNVGDEEWPAGVRLQFHDGERLSDFRTLINNGAAVASGAEVVIALDCRVPDVREERRVVSRFHLYDQDGKQLTASNEPLELAIVAHPVDNADEN